ncbi:hypothetical protein ScPMuIL_016542 [Solemya velum]
MHLHHFPRGQGLPLSCGNIRRTVEDYTIHSSRINNNTGMLKTYIVCLSMIVALVLSTVTQARILPNAEERVKRQSADVKAAEYLAYIALGGKLPHGCPDVACGLVDVIASGRKKRSGPIFDHRISVIKNMFC